MTTFEIARTVIYRNACPLDLERWQYHFENGTMPEVLYRKCGFVGNDIWHILCAKEQQQVEVSK